MHSNSYGLECLFRFYSYGLEKHFNALLFGQFQDAVRRDLAKSVYFMRAMCLLTDIVDNLYGLEKLWAFMKFQKISETLSVEPDLATELAKYKKSADFAAAASAGQKSVKSE